MVFDDTVAQIIKMSEKKSIYYSDFCTFNANTGFHEYCLF